MLKRDKKDNITQTSLTDEVDRLLDEGGDFVIDAGTVALKQDSDSMQLDLEVAGGVTAEEAIAVVAVETQVDDNEAVPLKKRGGNLKKRLIVAAGIAVVYTTVLLITLLLGGVNSLWRIVFDVFVVTVSVIAAVEMCGAVGNKFPKPLKAFVITGIILGFSAFYLVHFVFTNPAIFDARYGERAHSGGITAFFFVLAAVFLVCIVYNMFSKKTNKNNVLATMFVLFYPVTISVYMLSLNYLRPTEGSMLTDGYGFANAGILLMFLIPVFADSGAYIVGSLIKGKKLAPRISPKKTISGAVGGVLSGTLAGGIVLLLSHYGALGIGRIAYSNAWNIAHFLILGTVGAVFVIVGDLIASYIKRQCEIKDFSKLLPGHGGILDRIDSMLLGAVFLYIYLFILTFI